MSEESKEDFFFKGIFYPDHSEFWKAIERYASSRINPHSMSALIRDFERGVFLNLFEMGSCELNNEEMGMIIDEMIGSFILKVRKKEGEKNV